MYRFTKSNRTYREADGKLIRGTFLEALFKSGTILSSAGTSFSYVTGQIKIYADGMIECWGRRGVALVDLDEFKRFVQEGKMVTSIPEGARVYLGAGIHLIATEVNSSVEPQDLIREVEDELRGLRGEPTSDAVCAEAYAAYLQDPSDAGLERLRAAYEVVPGHLREFLMMPDGSERDLDDAIRALLGYPDD